MQAAERVGKAGREKLRHLFPLLIGKAGVLAVRFWIFEVDLLMRHVEIAAVDDGLFRVQLHEIRAQRILPLHAVRQALQSVLRVWRIAADKIERGIFRRDEPSLVVVFLLPQPIADADWRRLRQDRCAGIALFLRGIKIPLVAVQRKLRLLRLELGLLQADDVRILLRAVVQKSLAKAGPQAVDVP